MSQEPVFLFSATFRIKGAGNLHGEITRAMGISPTFSYTKGEGTASDSKDSRQWVDDLWALSSPLPEKSDLSAHLRWLWETLSPRKEYLERLVREGVEMDIACVYKSDSETAGFSIDADALAVACELNVPIEVSVMIDDIPENEEWNKVSIDS